MSKSTTGNKPEKRAFRVRYTFTMTAQGHAASMTQTVRQGALTVQATCHEHAIRIAHRQIRQAAAAEAGAAS